MVALLSIVVLPVSGASVGARGRDLLDRFLPHPPLRLEQSLRPREEPQVVERKQGPPPVCLRVFVLPLVSLLSRLLLLLLV